MSEFSDQVIVITGAAGNLGQAAAFAFHNAGAKLALVDRQREHIQAVFGDTIPEGEYCLPVAADLMDEDSVSEMAGRIEERFGRIDALVNIAGGFAMGTPRRRNTAEHLGFHAQSQCPHRFPGQPGDNSDHAAPKQRQDRQHRRPGRIGRQSGDGALHRLQERRRAPNREHGRRAAG